MTFSLLLFAHWLGDFVFQSSKMAVGKSKDLKLLTIHVTVYSLVLLGFSIVLFNFEVALVFVLVNSVLHWITDFFTSRLAAKKQGNERLFFMIIGFDQLIHAFTLYQTFLYSYEIVTLLGL